MVNGKEATRSLEPSSKTGNAPMVPHQWLESTPMIAQATCRSVNLFAISILCSMDIVACEMTSGLAKEAGSWSIVYQGQSLAE